MGTSDDRKGAVEAVDHPDEVEKIGAPVIEPTGDTGNRLHHGRHVKYAGDFQEPADDAIGS